MPGRIFFRNEEVTVSSTEVVIGQTTFRIGDILSVRGARVRVRLLPVTRYTLLISTAADGEMERLRHREAYFIFQLVNAIQAAMAEFASRNVQKCSAAPAA